MFGLGACGKRVHDALLGHPLRLRPACLWSCPSDVGGGGGRSGFGSRRRRVRGLVTFLAANASTTRSSDTSSDCARLASGAAPLISAAGAGEERLRVPAAACPRACHLPRCAAPPGRCKSSHALAPEGRAAAGAAALPAEGGNGSCAAAPPVAAAAAVSSSAAAPTACHVRRVLCHMRSVFSTLTELPMHCARRRLPLSPLHCNNGR